MTKSRGIIAPRRQWTNEEDRIIAEHYPHTSSSELCDLLNCRISQLYNRANVLGLKKTTAFMRSSLSGCIQPGQRRGTSFEFKKGHAPWNKGTKGLQIGGEATQFKPGQLPHNTQPIGSYRVDKDGTLQRKVSNAKGNNSKRWRGVHELVWVEQNGPVPENHICVFKPGMRTAVLEEITADKVECISYAENMRRNTRHRYPQEINQLISLRAAINRQVNKRRKSDGQ